MKLEYGLELLFRGMIDKQIYVEREMSPLPMNCYKIRSMLGASMTLEKGRVFFVPHLLWHSASVFAVSFEMSPHFVPFIMSKRL